MTGRATKVVDKGTSQLSIFIVSLIKYNHLYKGGSKFAISI